MIRCTHCRELLPRDRNCSDLAVLVLHQMEEHPAAYVAAHPEARPYLADAGLLAPD